MGGLSEPIVVKYAKNPTGVTAGGLAATAKPVTAGGCNGAAAGGTVGVDSIEAVLATLMKNGAYPQLDRNHLVKVYVSGLPADATDTDLYKMFAPFGCPIGTSGATVMTREDGVGFVDVYDATKAQ